MKLAFFDIDRTLLSISSERYFARYLIKKRILTNKQYTAFLTFIGRYALKYGRHVLKKNKAYLYQLPKQKIQTLAKQFVTDELQHYIRRDVLNKLNNHLVNGDAVILLSGTLNEIALALGEHLKVPHVSATLCQFDSQERFSCAPPITHPFDQVKKELAQKICLDQQQKLDQAFAYGDSIYDLSLLEAVATPVATYPDKKLKKIATRRKWQIVDNHSS